MEISMLTIRSGYTIQSQYVSNYAEKGLLNFFKFGKTVRDSRAMTKETKYE
jgi:hypothetical protein